MNYYLLVWNPKRWPWDELQNDIKKLRSSGFVLRDWSCGLNKSIEYGDRIFLIRLGEEPRGIVAHGKVEKERHEDRHWDGSSKRNWYVTVKFDTILRAGYDPILPLQYLKTKYKKMHWESQMSGVKIPGDVASKVEKGFNTLKKFALY